MQLSSNSLRLALMMTALVVGSGCCSHLHHLPDECAAAIYEFDLPRAIHNVCSCEPLPACASGIACGEAVGCGVMVGEECEVVNEQPCDSCPLARRRRLTKRREYVVGPSPERYQPLMPPAFLPVPTNSVFSHADVIALPEAHKTVEVGFGSQLTFPVQE